ncbi:type II secretion system protein N [Shewanella sp. 202IG2-18]|uniref:type II secretion system protein N n=1 Tax=Parashewanella hymeniacidonis TaxID=2807618 RepID=UPI00196170DF|nr:type II secretion system protein N [Parashewanella hymeniacidonis]
MNLSKKIIIGIAIYFVFLVVLIPAKVVMTFIPLPSNVKVANIDGSLWQGRASSIQVMGKAFDQVHWNLNPWALLIGKVSADITVGSKATSFNTKGHISYSFSGAQIENLNLGTNADFILAGQRLPFGTKASGDITLHINEFVQGAPMCEALAGKVLLHHVNVNNQFGVFPLGDLAFGLSCEQGEAVLTAKESDNQLGVSGTVSIGENNRYKVAAKLKPTKNLPEMIRNNLQYLGQPDSQGYYQINYQGRLPI